MDLSAVRSIVTCERCGNFYESPIKLPCFNTMCSNHVNEFLKKKSKNVIECFFCKKEHQVPISGFESYVKLEEIIQSKSHLYTEEKELILFIENSAKKIKDLNVEMEVKQPDTLEIVLKRLSDLKNQIGLDVAKLKEQIDGESARVLKRLETFEEKCIKTLNEIKKNEHDHFIKDLNVRFNEEKRSSKFDREKIISLKKLAENNLNEMEEKLHRLEIVKDWANNLSYKSKNIRIDENFFGKIEEKVKNFKIITASYDNTISIWENETCLQFLNQRTLTRSLDVYNSKILITGSKDGEIRFFTIDDMTLVKTLSESNVGHVFCLLVTLGGDLIAGFGDGTIKIYNLETFTCVKTLKEHTSHCWSIILFENDLFFSSSSDGKIIMWNLVTGLCEKSFKNNDSVNCLIKYGKNIISGDDNGSIKIWNIDNFENEILNGHDSYVFSLDIQTETGLLLSSDGIGCIKIWNCRNLVCIRTLKRHKDFISYLKFVDNQRFVSFSADGRVYCWDLKDLEKVKVLVEHNYGFRCGKILFNF